MKTFIAALLTSSLISPAVAGDSRNELCTSISSYANVVMTARQAGFSMSKLMSVAGLEDPAAAGAKEIVIAAYGQRRWNSERGQQRAIEDFENDIHLGCMRGEREETE